MTDERKGLPSASGLERIAACPGSWALERNMPEEAKGEGAASGTRIHEYLATGKSDGMTPEELDTACKCDVLAAELCDRYASGGDEISEHRFWMPQMSGKVDRIYVADSHVLIIDFKTGREGAAVAQGNWQLRALAVLAWLQYECPTVFVAIVQPWVSPTVSVCEYDRNALLKAYNEIMSVLMLAFVPSAPRKTGDHCKYCRAKTVCPEAQGAVTRLAFHGEQALEPSKIAAILEACDLAEDVIKANRAKAKELLTLNPEAIPGWRLKPGNRKRTVTNPQGAFAALSHIIDGATFASCCTVKIGELEKAVKGKSKITLAEAKATTAELIASHVEEKQNEPSLERI